jgi:hypothetical protein
MGNDYVINEKTLSWLLEPDDPGVRYLAMRELVHSSPGDLMEAKKKAHTEGPISTVLVKMEKDGYWRKPGTGYNPKYFGTVWSIILLSQLGASIEMDGRLVTACSYLLDHALTENGQFGYNGTPSGTIDCLQGNLCAALLGIGIKDPRLDKAFEWMARSVTGNGVAPVGDESPLRYYAYKCGPCFVCGANGKKPCAWGAVKVMLAFSKLPENKKTPLINDAIKTGIAFLFSTDPAKADYPTRTGGKPSRDWWKFGFPVFYVTDLLQNVEALAGLGYGHDPRLRNAIDIIREKRDAEGRWTLEYDYAGKTWVDLGALKTPNKWVTLRAMRVLKQI